MLTEWINANYTIFVLGIILISIWEIIWKSTAMWKASKRNSKIWFVVLMVLNTAGILPILYHLFIKEKKVKPIVDQDKQAPKTVGNFRE